MRENYDICARTFLSAVLETFPLLSGRGKRFKALASSFSLRAPHAHRRRTVAAVRECLVCEKSSRAGKPVEKL